MCEAITQDLCEARTPSSAREPSLSCHVPSLQFLLEVPACAADEVSSVQRPKVPHRLPSNPPRRSPRDTWQSVAAGTIGWPLREEVCAERRRLDFPSSQCLMWLEPSGETRALSGDTPIQLPAPTPAPPPSLSHRPPPRFLRLMHQAGPWPAIPHLMRRVHRIAKA